MCWEIDYKFFAEQERKANEARIRQQQRADVIGRLLNEASNQSDDAKTEKPAVGEVIPAK